MAVIRLIKGLTVFIAILLVGVPAFAQFDLNGTCATALSIQNEPVRVSFTANGRASLKVDVEKSDGPIPEVGELFLPSQWVEYKASTGDRLRIGLYVCREIVRVHNGNLEAHQVSARQPEFVLDLPL